MFSLLMTGIRRRKKEIFPIVLVTLIITFFMSGILMVQNILNAYIKEALEENDDRRDGKRHEQPKHGST